MRCWELHIEGRVQGVGFRPYVYRLACALGLPGRVSNGADGVRIILASGRERAEEFTEMLLSDPPPLAVIVSHSLRPVAGAPLTDFRIAASVVGGVPDQLIAPDFAMCADCERETLDPSNRRYRYPFTTCTNCGPRYAILAGLPYDRERTGMASFEMCAACREEYEDPDNRRYHSQTNSCPDCGIQLTTLAGTRVNSLHQISEQLEAGAIVAIKATAGYLLCCDAVQTDVIEELRRRKERPDKPLALLCADLDSIRPYAHLDDRLIEALRSPAGPIVLLPKKDSELSPAIAPDSAYLGVQLPNHPLLALIARDFGRPLVATSANFAGEPILTDGREESLSRLADHVIGHNLPITQPQDDSLVRITETSRRRIVLRRGRGLAPALNPTAAQPAVGDLLAVGADLKASFAVSTGGRCYLSPILGNLSGLGAQTRYRRTLDRLLELAKARPERLVVDLHPSYFSGWFGREWAEQWGVEINAVQHHEAHFAAVLGEHDLLDAVDDVLGVVWDGTGYGRDGHIWGGEFFRFGTEGAFERVEHLPYCPYLGGDKMAREPAYSALAWGGEAVADLIRRRRGRLAPSLDNLLHLRSRQKMLTSSVGRLFDAVAFLLGVGEQQTYEGQAAARLESLAREGQQAYPSAKPYHLDSLLAELINDVGKAPNALVALRFHLTLVDWVARIARRENVSGLAFSGGCFQNALLVDLLDERLGRDFRLYFHEQLPPNDENIAYGQIIHTALTARPVRSKILATCA